MHVVIQRHERRVERIIAHMKAQATRSLRERGQDPLAELVVGEAAPSPWAHKAWHVYLDDPEGMARAIEYVRENPMKEGKPPQRWTFVSPWEA